MVHLFIACMALHSPQSTPAVRSEVVIPIRNASFNLDGSAKKWKQGGPPKTLEGKLVFEGSSDGNRQVDPQIAVGGGYVLHATNHGILIFDKKGKYVDGVPQSEFIGGIDPKMFFDVHHRRFVFNLWNPWDADKLKPVNISVAETSDPTGAWNTYQVPAPKGVDGGAIGYSQSWIGYSFPGGENRTFVFRNSAMDEGMPIVVFHFAGNLGQPAFNQDSMDDMFFVSLTDKEIMISRVGQGNTEDPVIKSVVRREHGIANMGYPPASPMRGTDAKTASGDRNPKNVVLQSGSLWFSHTVNVDGRAAVQWHQFKLDGTKVQSGLLSHPVNSYIQTSIAVNQKSDVLVGFQETGPDMFISARCAIWRKGDRAGTLRPFFKFAEGLAATEGGAWGDYSGSIVDGDNLRDMWTVQSVANLSGKGSTVITRVKG